MVERTERLEEWLIGPAKVWYMLPFRLGGILLLPLALALCSILRLIELPFNRPSSMPVPESAPFHEDVLEADFEVVEDLKRVGGLVLLEFWADWCAPCFTMKPAISKLAEEYGGTITIASIDATAHTDLSRSYDVRGLPTLILLRQGEELARHSGVLKFKQLKRFVNEHLDDL